MNTELLLSEVQWPDSGLLPVVVQHGVTGEVLQVAYANREALALTQDTGKAYFFSRSRQELWEKGKTSGNSYAVTAVRLDCDGDAVPLRVDQQGPACHTERPNCFYNAIRDGEVDVISDLQGSIRRPAADQR